MSPLSPLTVRKRGAKVNAKQKKILLQFMADNPSIFLRKITTDFTVEHHKAFWQNMSAVLNIFGPPRKTVESWKKVHIMIFTSNAGYSLHFKYISVS